MLRMFGVTMTAALLASVVGGCGAAGDEDGEGEEGAPESAESEINRGPHPQLPHLPNVTGIMLGGCTTQLTGCSLRSTDGSNVLVKSRRIYDSFFQQPRTDAQWGWTPIATDERRMLLARPPILPLPIGTLPAGTVAATKAEYDAWMSLRPDPWETSERLKALRHSSYTARPASQLPFTRIADPASTVRNLDVIAEHASDGSLPARHWGRAKTYEEQNPFDWLAAGVTHYQAPASESASDIMATQLVYRVLLAPYQMEQALADCKADPAIPCAGTIAALSRLDLYRVYEVRFVRPTASGGLEISRVFRMVSVDSGHAIDRQATLGPGATNHVTGVTTPQGFSTPFLKTYAQRGPNVLWRMEVSGQIAQSLGAVGTSMAALVRYSPNNDDTPAQAPPAGSCTDVNDGEWKCDVRNGRMTTLKCQHLQWLVYTTGCAIPGR